MHWTVWQWWWSAVHQPYTDSTLCSGGRAEGDVGDREKDRGREWAADWIFTEFSKDGCSDTFQPVFSSTVWPHSWGEDCFSTLLNPRGPVTTLTSRLQQTGHGDSSTHSLSLPGSFCFLPLGMFIMGGIRCHIKSPVTLGLPFREEAQSSHVKRLCGKIVPAIPDMGIKIPSYTHSLVEPSDDPTSVAITYNCMRDPGWERPCSAQTTRGITKHDNELF